MAAIGKAVTDLSRRVDDLLPRPHAPEEPMNGMSREDAEQLLRSKYRVRMTISLTLGDQKDSMYAATMGDTPEEVTEATIDLARIAIERMLKGWISR